MYRERSATTGVQSILECTYINVCVKAENNMLGTNTSKKNMLLVILEFILFIFFLIIFIVSHNYVVIYGIQWWVMEFMLSKQHDILASSMRKYWPHTNDCINNKITGKKSAAVGWLCVDRGSKIGALSDKMDVCLHAVIKECGYKLSDWSDSKLYSIIPNNTVN